MKAKVLDIGGKKAREITLPSFFSFEIRYDVISRVLEARKTKQPYAPLLVAGKQHSASGKIRHRRHVWKSGYGRGASRIPRKIMSRRGSQFNWVGATIPGAVGGRRAHPPKILSMINTKKINKKEMQLAMKSAISATSDEIEVKKRYSSLRDKKIDNLPLIVEGKFLNLKTKQLLVSLKKILGKELFGLAVKKRKVRAGKGKLRGRKYKKNAGLLLVLGKGEKKKTNAFETKSANKVSLSDLAEGGVGRLTLYTEKAIKDLDERLG